MPALAMMLQAGLTGRQAVSMAVFWPIVSPIVIVVIIYQSTIKSTKHIRRDLYNRRLLKEFDEYIDKKKTNGPEQ